MRILVTCNRCREPCIKTRYALVTTDDKKPFYLCGACSDELSLLRHSRMVRKLHVSSNAKQQSQRRNVAAFKAQHPEATADEKRPRAQRQRT